MLFNKKKKKIKNRLIDRIAIYCVSCGLKESFEGNYIFCYSELALVFKVSIKIIKDNIKQIVDSIEKYDSVSDVVIYDDCIDINFYTDYLLNDSENW